MNELSTICNILSILSDVTPDKLVNILVPCLKDFKILESNIINEEEINLGNLNVSDDSGVLNSNYSTKIYVIMICRLEIIPLILV